MESVARDLCHRCWLCLIEYKNVIILYSIGLIVAGVYAFLHNFTTVSDTRNEFLLYQSYIQHGIRDTWEQYSVIYPLQVRCLTSTLLPALLHRIIPVDPLMLYKAYMVILVPLLPVGIYLLAKKLLTKWQSVCCGLLVISQTTFIQSPSNFRTVIAIAFGCFMLYFVLLSDNKLRYLWTAVFASLVVISHYGTMIIFGIALIPVIVLETVRSRYHRFALSALAFVILLGAGCSWHPQALNQLGWITRTPISSEAQNYIAHADNLTAEAVARETPARDKIVQVLLGRHEFDDGTRFTFSWPLYLMMIGMALTIGFGMVYALLKKKLPIEYLLMGAVYGVLAILMIAVPYVSKIYGIERLWLQSLTVLAPCFVIGFAAVIRKNWIGNIALAVFIGAFFYFNYNYGLIWSIMG